MTRRRLGFCFVIMVLHWKRYVHEAYPPHNVWTIPKLDDDDVEVTRLWHDPNLCYEEGTFDSWKLLSVLCLLEYNIYNNLKVL